MHNLWMGKTLWNIKLELFLLDLFFILTSFSSLSLSLSLRLPWHSIIKLARTSRFPVPHVWNPITRQQFMLCEDALLFQYWDVKLHTGPLMHSGNHSLLLRLLATKLSEDLVTGERKSELLTFSPLSLSLSFFDHDFLQLFSAIVFPLFSALYLSSVPRRGFIAQSSMAGRLMRRPQFSDSWHLPGDSPWHAHDVGFTANKQTSRRLEMPPKRQDKIASLNNLIYLLNTFMNHVVQMEFSNI